MIRKQNDKKTSLISLVTAR